MRSRIIKPGFFQNEVLAKLPELTRLYFIGLWLIADREGLLEYRPMYIKGLLFPHHEANIEAMTVELMQAGFVQLYADDSYLQIINWEDNQKIYASEKESQIPAPQEDKNDNGVLEKRHIRVGVRIGVRVRIKEVENFVKLYMEHCPSLHRVTKITTKRHTRIKNILEDEPDMDKWIQYFKICESTSFLGGSGRRGWRAGLDFVTNENNMVKILEGNYNWEQKTKQDKNRKALTEFVND